MGPPGHIEQVAHTRSRPYLIVGAPIVVVLGLDAHAIEDLREVDENNLPAALLGLHAKEVDHGCRLPRLCDHAKYRQGLVIERV